VSKGELKELSDEMPDIERRIYMVPMPLKKRQKILLYKAACDRLGRGHDQTISEEANTG
jgi:hypothetical protein